MVPAQESVSGGVGGNSTEIRLFVPVDVETLSEEAGVLGEGGHSNKADIHVHNLALITCQKATCSPAERICY